MPFPKDHMLGSRRNGVNHVGMETPFWEGGPEPIRGTTYPLTDDALLDWYATNMGMRAVRVMICWEAIQDNPNPLPAPPVAAGAMGAIPVATGGRQIYWTDLVQLVIRLIDRGIYVAVCPWQHNPASSNTDITYRGLGFEPEHFADFWGKFATAINASIAAGFPPDPRFPADAARPDRLAFDLINEPHEAVGGADVGISFAGWQACAQQAINAIRADAGNQNTILVEGMGFASARLDRSQADLGDPESALWKGLADPLGNLAISVHCYEGTRILPGEAAAEKPADAMRKACDDLVGWARGHGLKVHIGEVAVDAGVGGCSSLPQAQDKWADWNDFCRDNDDVLMGWNWWANTSKNWGWPDEGSCQVGKPDIAGGRNWALTHDDGAKATVHAVLIKPTIAA
jgi:aryl-phospho-beta-D-glucosidase BglC (GH1 family)